MKRLTRTKPMSQQSIALSATEEAFVAMVLEEHKALIGAADQRREQRMRVLLNEKGIPEGIPVKVDRTETGAVLLYEAP